jgi:phosphoglycolate phosphatase-like HAD superfamily hydrolase
MKIIKNILWDFDGVILDSMKVRDWGFREIFKSFDNEKVEELLKFHTLNGGLSRYVKIRYFYEDILGKELTENVVLEYANAFSVLMKKELINPNNLIVDSVQFIRDNYNKYRFHIVSGSDQEELRYLCKELAIDHYFLSIHGSPTPKNQLVRSY